ncbi:MAG: lytic transglycosylase domain-containing protein [Myxococcota bacterium]
MSRIHLALLATCALLSTTLEPDFSAFDASSQREALGLAAADESPLATADDEALVAHITSRLALRRTSLSGTERRTLAETIVREAHAQGLAPHLVAAVIEVESAGHHRAVSHVGALGLMQILPATGRELAAKHGVPWSGPETLFDPQINVKLGVAYLRELTNRYGDVSLALAAYNWGPAVIDRRLRDGDKLPSEYIDSVMRAFVRDPAQATRPS